MRPSAVMRRNAPVAVMYGAAVVVLLLAGCATRKTAFNCTTSDQCGAGTCEATGYCSFADSACVGTQRRYGEFSAPALALQCVIPPCGGAGDVCCATGSPCNGAALSCVAGVCRGCFVSVAAGAAHTAAVRTDGHAFAWGANDAGQLGIGSIAGAPLPAPVVDGNGTPLSNMIVAIAGARHTCYVTAVHALACSGDGARGQLGTGAAQAKTPTLIGLAPVTAWAAGDFHTCAADGSARVWCWGANDAGQLGTGGGDATMPAPVVSAAGVQLDHVVALAAGHAHTCALRDDHHVWCWGDGSDGQLGGGTTASSAHPVEVSALGASTLELAAGGALTCARTDTQVLCFGADASGQAGQPATARVPVPTAVPGLDLPTALSVGGAHACARRADGTVRCWGAGARGQLGDGAAVDRSTPGPFGAMLVGAVSVAAGGAHTCVVGADGVVCSGAGDAGQLGDGTATDRAAPVAARVGCP